MTHRPTLPQLRDLARTLRHASSACNSDAARQPGASMWFRGQADGLRVAAQCIERAIGDELEPRRGGPDKQRTP
jgi:hypothetical protein